MAGTKTTDKTGIPPLWGKQQREAALE